MLPVARAWLSGVAMMLAVSLLPPLRFASVPEPELNLAGRWPTSAPRARSVCCSASMFAVAAQAGFRGTVCAAVEAEPKPGSGAYGFERVRVRRPDVGSHREVTAHPRRCVATDGAA